MVLSKPILCFVASLLLVGRGTADPNVVLSKEHNSLLCTEKPTFDPFYEDVNPFLVPEENTEYCPKELSIVPQNYRGQLTREFFSNEEKKPVDLFWVNENGVEVFTDRIQPGEVKVVKTFEGHLFHVRIQADEGGKLLVRHRVGKISFANPGQVCSSEPFEKLEFEDLSNAPGPKGLGCNFKTTTFSNHVGCPINLFHYNGNKERLVGQLGSHSTIPVNEFSSNHMFEATYLDHQFRARLTDGTLVGEHTIKRVRIGPCPLRRREPIAISDEKIRFEIRNTIGIQANQTDSLSENGFLVSDDSIEVYEDAVSWTSSSASSLTGSNTC
mmetsp:Transcript_2770/g.3511  ORF Transcript_2770/g.3511 Transcript_2770/m.3511 type:complete len:327 (-) Transcript_2770:1512-2492(-)|eukprot:CAMPEP_0204851766 /NCGR_PEP_ID=MMETSP1347-20130617/10644_1 /ASSEMBLY_ACC=CAM_ASM_000690 /TAXON_ID=215587 /ORGANISM="Aplanochytrium stocchinoi, Strain GSBS06" /LENGTH=326 /DNA_ID=CAMNT_0051995651 /DNA_START=150 /DNA_END=1130 /DNA_ORIENTATION=-